MNYDLIKELKPWVTTFSEVIKLKYSHGNEICVGGEIKNIFNLTQFFKNLDTMVQINIDDKIGEMALLFPKEIYDEFNKQYKLKKGNIILAKGKVYDPFKAFDNEYYNRENIPAIICWHMEPLYNKKIKERGK